MFWEPSFVLRLPLTFLFTVLQSLYITYPFKSQLRSFSEAVVFFTLTTTTLIQTFVMFLKWSPCWSPCVHLCMLPHSHAASRVPFVIYSPYRLLTCTYAMVKSQPHNLTSLNLIRPASPLSPLYLYSSTLNFSPSHDMEPGLLFTTGVCVHVGGCGVCTYMCSHVCGHFGVHMCGDPKLMPCLLQWLSLYLPRQGLLLNPELTNSTQSSQLAPGSPVSAS